MLSILLKSTTKSNEKTLIQKKPVLIDVNPASSYDSKDFPSAQGSPTSTTKPIEIKYYVPKQLEIQGLSQSLVCHTDPYYQKYVYDDVDVDFDFEDDEEVQKSPDVVPFPTIKHKEDIFYSCSVPNELVLTNYDEMMNPLHSPNFRQYLSAYQKEWSSQENLSTIYRTRFENESYDHDSSEEDFYFGEACVEEVYAEEAEVEAHVEEDHFEEACIEEACIEEGGVEEVRIEEAPVEEAHVEGVHATETYIKVAHPKETHVKEEDERVFAYEDDNAIKEVYQYEDYELVEASDTFEECFIEEEEFIEPAEKEDDEEESLHSLEETMSCCSDGGDNIFAKDLMQDLNEDPSPEIPCLDYGYGMERHASEIEDYIQIKSRNDQDEGARREQEEAVHESSLIQEYYSVQELNGACYYYGPLAKPYQKYHAMPLRRAASLPSSLIPTIPEVDEDLEEWTELANNKFGESSSLWNVVHGSDFLLEKLKMNPFIRLYLSCHVYPLKVTDLPKSTQYKEVQNHFFDSSILYIRHLRHYHCAYIVYRNYHEMMRGYYQNHLSLINKKPIKCEPSTMADLERDYEIDVQRRLSCTKRIVNKKYDTFIPNYHQIDQNLECFLRHQIEQMQEEAYPKASKYDIPKAQALHVLIKPQDTEELDYIKQRGYLPVQADKVEYLNEVFSRTPEVIFLVSKKQGRQFQGLAKMQSEVLDAASCGGGASLGLKANWHHHLCKVEWLLCAKVPMKQVGDLCNPWNDGRCIRYTPAVTLIEPGVANTIIKLMEET